MKNINAKITVFILTAMLVSCNAVKRVKEGELLLAKNTVYVNDQKVNNEDLNGLISQKPNSLFRLHIFNLAKENPDSIYNAKLDEHLANPSFFDKIISEKQLRQVADYKIGFHKWLKTTGEAPVIINPISAEKSAKRLKLYHDVNGFFNNEVSFEIDSLEKKEKRGTVTYKVQTGNPYFIDSLTQTISSKPLDSIYQMHKDASIIKEGQQFRLSNFEAERERLNSLFLNSGIYKFQPTSISFDIYRDTLAVNNDYKMPVDLKIDNVFQREGDSVNEIEYKVHTIENVNIYADYNFNDNKDSLQSITYNNYRIFYKDKLKYKPRALTDAIAVIPGDVYKDLDRTLTYRQIGNLRTFKYPNIDYVYADSTSAKLNTNIYLAARPRFSLGFNTDVSRSNIQDIGVSFSTSVISRNIFRGAETLEISARGTIGSSKEAGNVEDRFFNISEIGGDIKLNFPRIWFPFNTDRYIKKYMNPRTLLSLGTSFQKNIGLDKQTVTGILNYSWNPSDKVSNKLDLFNIQYVKNLNPDNYFNIYQSSYNLLNDIAVNSNYQFNTPDPENPQLEIPDETTSFTELVFTPNNGLGLTVDQILSVASIEQRRQRLTDNNLIFATNYSWLRNNRESVNDQNFSFIRWKVETAGNFLSAISGIVNLKENDNGDKTVTGVAYSQYGKGEVEYVKYIGLGKSSSLVFRAFGGIAIPYGNSDNIPFSRSYFAGGANDNRGWLAYDLGPGSSGGLLDFNEANFKLAFNAEYRFGLLGDLKGALFMDIGNIWNALDDVDSDPYRFDGFQDLSELAVALGPGFRYDFSFFILRLDVGFKAHDPSIFNEQKWFRDFNFGNAVYNIGINYPF